MAIEKDWSASAELNGMRKNPLFNRLRAQSTINTGRYGNLVQDVANYSQMSRGREQLNRFGNSQKGLILPNDNIGPAVNRRTAAATGSNADWAWPKLHDPFEWFRERCILPGELMNLKDGLKKVEDVVVGDVALTHKGRYRKIIGLGHKPFEGKAYSVEPYYLSKARVTVDHPFWAKKNLNDEPDWIKVQDLSKKDWVFIPVDREVVDVEKINLLDHLDANDWVVEDDYITGIKNGSHHNDRPLGNQIPVEFEVSDALLWLLGLYMAEGVSNNKALSWYLSNKEIEYRDKVISCAKEVFKLDARYSETVGDNTVRVELTCQPIATLFKQWFGNTAYDKHLPDWVMHLPKEKQLRILEGWLDGDGCYTPRTNHTFSVSAQLTEQMRMIMLRCGYFPSVGQRIQRKFDNSGRTYKTHTQLVLLARDHYQFLEDTNNIDDDGFVRGKSKLSFKPVNGARRFPVVEDNEGVWVQIRKIEDFDYSGEIYYFTVDEDHSFVIADQGVKNTWWFNMEDPDEQTRKIRDWARLIYTTHYLVPSMIDIYSRFPLLGMEFAHPDKRVNEFFSELFWDGLQYQDFLYSMSREHWLIGDAFALGSWNDGIGAWEADELINPNDVVVAKNRALRTYQYHIKVPEEVKKLVETRQPEKEYAMLMAMYPDVVEYARKDVEIPVSDVIMKGLPYATNPWAEHGTPILMRAFRQLMMEESLQASMEAISDRLYSPLILATLGLPDADQDGPWIPDAEELGALRDDLAMAINADFRLMVYHHGLQIQNAFGRESMPRLDQDFYRIQANYMMVFGIGSELLQGGKSGATYASGALNRELITQMLTTHQHQIKHFIQGRMRAVAERQGFYEYRNVGGHPVPIMETVLVVDEETGAQFVEERPKLAIPDIIFQSMSLQDENVEHAFLQQLAGMGLPVSFQTFTRNVDIDFEDEVETRKREKVDLVVAEQQVKKDIFDRCFKLQLPIPMEYQAEYESYVMQLQDPQLAEQLRPGAINDITSTTPTPNISGTPVHVDAGGIPDMYPSIANQETQRQRQHPVESHEQKKTEPKKNKGGVKNGPQKKTASIEDLNGDEIIVTSKRTNENIVIEDGEIVSNMGTIGGEWGRLKKNNPKQASASEDFNEEKSITYGDRMKLTVPWESQYRVQMKLANGQQVVVDNNYEQYDQMYMKDHIAKILESNVDNSEDNSFDDRLNEQTIPTRMDFGEHHPGMMGFDAPAIVGVPTEDMGPKVTFGSKEFPNRKDLDNEEDKKTS